MNSVSLMEEWKDIEGYEGLYLISNYGRVLSLRRFRENGNGGYYQDTKLLTQTYASTGYKKVELVKNKKKQSIKIHRLVAKHFVANPYNYNVVNHKDGNPENNYFENLEWCRQIDNVNHAIEIGLKNSFNIDKKSLEYLYLVKNKTPKDIGNIFGISRDPVDRKIEEYGIKKDFVTTYQIEEKWLKNEILKGTKNVDIAKQIGCDKSLISKYKTRLKNKGEIYG